MAEYKAVSHYQIMWIYVFFDLPTGTKKQRKAASRFRKDLIQDGFSMLQYSVYIRNCASNESTAVHLKRVQAIIPEEGIVSMMKVTDRQFGETITTVGKKATPMPSPSLQLELF